jgi:hypothetical protein
MKKRFFAIKSDCLATHRLMALQRHHGLAPGERTESLEKRLKKLILSVTSVAYPTKYQRTENYWR